MKDPGHPIGDDPHLDLSHVDAEHLSRLWSHVSPAADELADSAAHAADRQTPDQPPPGTDHSSLPRQ